MELSKCFFFLLLISISCGEHEKNCIVDLNVSRSDTPSPDVVELVFEVSDPELFDKLVNGEFESIYVKSLREQNLKYLFPIPDQDILSEFRFRLYFETSYFYESNDLISVQIDKYLRSAEVIVVFFDKSEILFAVCQRGVK